MKNECIFCKIIKGEIPSFKIYEDDVAIAFLDIRPLNPGHTLVISKKHYRWVWDIENIGEFYERVRKIVLAIKRAYKTNYVVSLVFGEEVEHAHVWLVPRFENDGHGGAINLSNVKNIDKEQMQKEAEKIKKFL